MAKDSKTADSKPADSPIPEADTPAAGLAEPESNAEQLRGLFSDQLVTILTGILDRLDALEK